MKMLRLERAEVRRLAAQLGTPPDALVVTVIPTYRRADRVGNAARSALAQTITDHVVIVIDDAGGELGELPDDPRLIVLSLAHNAKTPAVVRNVGIRLTTSTYLAFLDDDNEWRADHLELCLRELVSNSGLGMTYTSAERRLASGELRDVVGETFDRQKMRLRSFVDASTIVMRRGPDAYFSRIPRTRYTEPKEDWELVHRFSRRHRVVHVDKPTVRYLVNDDSYFTKWPGAPKSE
jgi:glycosyltransferase involved in cell wall biosynthesis